MTPFLQKLFPTRFHAADQKTEPTMIKEQMAPLPIPPEPKSQKILASLARPEGASLDELVLLTGWTRHAVRAKLCHLRKAGHRLDCLTSTDDGPRRYRLADTSTDTSDTPSAEASA